ncbi:membrane protein required for colicin V production [Rhodovulum iodosum]|uniref:Membrane protein required for colicin V production n=1 Tax=Rhodovulum iodosum TaxID=68291 RepID=A0ABV3XWW5_9RHOB|nr:CvpA family protein [Rhodovulum robiginosum]RSK33580.1 CvpA family protein [Rhodovulum robiginosum]
MEAFTVIDAIVAVIIVVSAILAFSRGFVREAMAIAGWIAAAIVAFIFAPQAEPLVREIPVLGDFLGDSCEISMVAAFAGVFAVSLVVVSIFTPLFSSLVQRSALGGIDQGLGFIFGALRGIVLVAVAFFVYQTVMPSQEIEVVDQSRSAAAFAQLSERIADRDPEQALGWLTGQYEQLMAACEAPAAPQAEPAASE